MLYREYGNTGKPLSAIGFGGTRFQEADLNDEEGIERCAQIVVKAAKLGVNYFDIAYNYAKSQCEAIYKKALSRITQPVYISAKSSSVTDYDCDRVMARIESSLKNLGVDKIHFFYMWSIMSLKQYHEIMKKGGAYDGALKAKEQGMIEHIVFSSHASPEETELILREGAFEGVTIPYSLLNFTSMQRVLDTARERHSGVAVMNPLGGGIIPQNPKYFSKNFGIRDESVTDFSLRFIYAHPEITCILSGISKQEELLANTSALEKADESPKDYIAHVAEELTNLSDICTGCGYCVADCPQGINIPAYMQSYNMKHLDDTEQLYGRTDRQLISDIQVMKKMVLDYQELPENGQNKCIGCGQCEEKCTRHLPVRERLREVFMIAERTGATQEKHRERLSELLQGKGYQKVVFYTGGGYTAYVISEYIRYFGQPDFDIAIADSNPQKCGQKLGDYMIYNPKQMEEIHPDCVLISNFNYDQEIYETLKENYPDLNIQKLHRDTDVPWVF